MHGARSDTVNDSVSGAALPIWAAVSRESQTRSDTRALNFVLACAPKHRAGNVIVRQQHRTTSVTTPPAAFLFSLPATTAAQSIIILTRSAVLPTGFSGTVVVKSSVVGVVLCIQFVPNHGVFSESGSDCGTVVVQSSVVGVVLCIQFVPAHGFL